MATAEYQSVEISQFPGIYYLYGAWDVVLNFNMTIWFG